MSAYDCIERISNTFLINENLKFCFVTNNKRPIKPNGEPARPNKTEDFVDFEDLLECKDIFDYEGIGISIQASKICAIDVDHCFSKSNDISSINETGKQILDIFKDIAYCEFSFSGTGLRILFKHSLIDKYSDDFYIKNEKNQIEYYQPSTSYRYVTITGKVIYNNSISDEISTEVLYLFLNTYMKKPVFEKTCVNVKDDETLSIDELQKRVRHLYLTNSSFQNLWFGKAPGSGKNESELDFQILSYLYENVTQNHDMLKILFESSKYFKSKDTKHINKWTYQNFRYYEYVYSQIQRRKK